MSQKSGMIVRQNDARVLHAFGEEIMVLLDGERTAGKFAMWTEVTPPGGGPPPHYHLKEEELFHVISGRVGFLVNDSWAPSRPRRDCIYAAWRRSHVQEPWRSTVENADHDDAVRHREILRTLR